MQLYKLFNYNGGNMRNFIFLVSALIVYSELTFSNDYYAGNPDYNEIIYIKENKLLYFINACSYYIPAEFDKINDTQYKLITPKVLPDPDNQIQSLKLDFIDKKTISVSQVGCNSKDRLFHKITPKYIKSKVMNLRIREYPNTTSKILGVLNKNDRVVYIGTLTGEYSNKENLWCLIVAESGQKGYLLKKYVE